MKKIITLIVKNFWVAFLGATLAWAEMPCYDVKFWVILIPTCLYMIVRDEIIKSEL